MKDGDPWYTQKSTIAPAGTSYTTCPMGKAKYQDFTFYNGKIMRVHLVKWLLYMIRLRRVRNVLLVVYSKFKHSHLFEM